MNINLKLCQIDYFIIVEGEENMSRYIDADLLSADIQKYQCVSCSAEYSKDNIRCSACEIAECLRMIDNAPTTDVS